MCMQRIGRWGGFLVVAAMFAATGCGSLLPTGPRQAAEKFASAFAHRDVVAAARLTDQPEAAQAALTKAWTGLAATGLETDIGQVRTSGDTGTVDYAYRWRLAPGDWSYHGTLQMDDSAGDWKVRWSSTAVHPDLGADQELRVDATPAPMARVNTRSGPDVLVPGLVHAVLFDPDAAGPYAASSAAQLAAELSRFDRGLTAQSIVESATAAGGAYQVITLRGSDFQPLAASLSVLPGVRFQDRADLLPTDPGFAPDVIGRVRQDVVGSIRGTAGWSVVTVNPNGRTADVLTEHAPQPVPSFTLTLDRAVQNAAQRAVDHPAEPAVMVVLRPSTGELLAVAQNRAADAQGPLATTGRFPPGSTFKIVTAAAALAAGMAGPRTMVPCPGRVDVFTRTVPNYRGFALGTVPLTSAFAHSCNTTFAKLAGDMRPDALRRATAQLGLLARYGIEGLPTRPAS
ncbi:MAG: penicillin-binding transpeptidase domain-containing protein, partial [Mycobacteriaceae bacterium]|nr:penicillin-binding transpeptidase domain-containing protein [Mycobacteriaceae bacterium]